MTLTLTHQEIMQGYALLTQLGNYPFGQKARYAIRYNLAKLEAPAHLIREERKAILDSYGTPNTQSGQYDWNTPPDGERALEALRAFFDETETLDLRTITDDDLGDVAVPANLVPMWFCPIDNAAPLAEAHANGQEVAA